MNKKQSTELYLFVNEKTNRDALEFYTELRISALKDSLVRADGIEEVRRLQGAIEEVKRLKTLRDEVINPKD